MTVRREVFGVKFAQASLEQILPHPSQRKSVIPIHRQAQHKWSETTRNLFLNN